MSEEILKEFAIKIPEKLDEDKPVIIVDDQQDMRMIVAHQMRKLTFRNVIQARDGVDALEKLKLTQDVSLVIASMELPQISGLDLLSEMREDTAIKRPAFCLTMGQVDKDKLMLAVEMGVDEVIVKPFTLGDIVPKARKAFKAFHNPQNPEQVYELAKNFLRDNDLDTAQRIYELLHQSAPQIARPLVGLARVHFHKKNIEKALSCLELAEKNNAAFVHLYSLRGEIYTSQGQIPEAIQWYKKAIDLSPLNPVRYIRASELLINEKKYEEALTILEIAIDKKVSFPALFHNLGQAYYYLDDYKSSIKYLQKALDQEPENITYLNQLALSHKECKEFEEANKLYNRVIKLDPDNIQALYNKAIMLAQNNQPQDAIKILERLVKKHPDFSKGSTKLAELQKITSNKAAS